MEEGSGSKGQAPPIQHGGALLECQGFDASHVEIFSQQSQACRGQNHNRTNEDRQVIITSCINQVGHIFPVATGCGVHGIVVSSAGSIKSGPPSKV